MDAAVFAHRGPGGDANIDFLSRFFAARPEQPRVGDRSIEAFVVGGGRGGEELDLYAAEATGSGWAVRRVIGEERGKKVSDRFRNRTQGSCDVENEARRSEDPLVHRLGHPLCGIRIDHRNPAAVKRQSRLDRAMGLSTVAAAGFWERTGIIA